MDIGLPDDGIAACSSGDNIWAIADIDFACLRAPAAAQVAVDVDWPLQTLRAGVLLFERVDKN